MSWNLLNAAAVLSGSVQWLPQPAVRLGLEVNSEIFDALYGLRLQEAQQLEHSIVLRFSSDKINSVSEIRSLRAGAESALCIGRPVAAFDDAAVFLAALPKLNPYLAEMLAENALASDSAALYANVRKQFYGRSVMATAIGSAKGSDNAGSGVGVESTKGYGIELKRIDKTLFPLEANIVRVVDSAGRTLTGLSSLDFRTRDTSIVSVRRLDSVTTVPVAIVLLLDCSGSMHINMASSYFSSTVRSSDGQSQIAFITLTDADANIIRPFRTAADGTFRQAIPEGKKYRLFVQPLHSDSVGIVVRTLDASRLLKGDTLKQDVMLLPPTILRRNVRDERGTPLQADIYLEDNLGFEFPVTATKRLKSGEGTGNYELVIVPGRKYRVKTVPVRSTLFEPLEYELDAKSFKAGIRRECFQNALGKKS